MATIERTSSNPLLPLPQENISYGHCGVSKIAINVLVALGLILMTAGLACSYPPFGLAIPSIALIVTGATLALLGTALMRAPQNQKKSTQTTEAPHPPPLDRRESFFLECGVCSEPFSDTDKQKQPWSLSCGHSFCASCIDGVRNAEPARQICFECRTAWRTDPTKNFALIQLLEMQARQMASMVAARTPSDS